MALVVEQSMQVAHVKPAGAGKRLSLAEIKNLTAEEREDLAERGRELSQKLQEEYDRNRSADTDTYFVEDAFPDAYTARKGRGGAHHRRADSKTEGEPVTPKPASKTAGIKALGSKYVQRVAQAVREERVRYKKP